MNHKYIAPIFMIVALAFAALACDSPLPAATEIAAPTSAPTCDTGKATIALTKQDNGRSINLKKGERFAVALGSNHTTGFEWDADTFDAKLLNFDGKTYQGTGFAVGSGGTETLCFTAIETGKAPVTLIYHRQFEKGVPPAETFKLTVEIK